MIERHFYPTPGFCCCTNSGRDEPAMRTGRGPFGSNLSSQFEVTCCAECIGPLCALAHGLSPSSLVPAPAGWAEPGGPRRRWRPMAPAPSHWCLSRHTPRLILVPPDAPMLVTSLGVPTRTRCGAVTAPGAAPQEGGAGAHGSESSHSPKLGASSDEEVKASKKLTSDLVLLVKVPGFTLRTLL